MLTKHFICLLLIIHVLSHAAFAQKRYKVSGTVMDAATGETLIGATLRIKSGTLTQAASTNSYGFYSFSLPEGDYELVTSYTGYQTLTKTLQLHADQRLSIELQSGTQLTEVVISAADRKNERVTSPQMGVEKLDMQSINNVPVLFGERDILKTIQLLPGIKAGGEGNTGFYVRGGAADQNLILLDEATVYNSSHLLGFFSTFNSDAIKDVSIYKGGMPAQYGGRLSAVLDVNMDEGNYKNYGVQGGIGLIASRLKAEGPIVKDKGSFMLSGRRTYADLFLKASKDSVINGSTLNFYDLNAKANYKINSNNSIYVSGYFGRDNIGIRDLFENNWGNTTATLRLNHVFNNRLFSNTSFIYNKYDYSIKLLDEGNDVKVTSLIRDFNLKEDLQYFTNGHNIRSGINLTHHRISPSDISASEKSSFNSQFIENRYGLELAGYLSDEWAVNDHFNLLYGARISTFTLLGAGTFNTYNASGTITENKRYGKNKAVKSYINIEPRFSAAYTLNEQNSVKASYNRNTQNIHILTNATSSSPTDQYVMSSNNIRPEIADQLALGYFKNSASNTWEFSGEVYYKWLQNQIEYKNGAQLIANAEVESQLLYGTGRAYGIELFAKKRIGKLNGWLGYTLSKTERKFAALNNGAYFPARYDRTHDVALVAIYNRSARWTFSGNFIYSTGNAVTFPAGKYVVGGLTTYYYTNRNANRMPATTRLDLNATLEGKSTKKFSSGWSFGLYNALNRKNPYSIDFQDAKNDPTRTEAVRIALFGIIPSVTWNFKF